MEIIFDPQPNAADSIEFPHVMTLDKMDAEGGTADSANATTLVDATA